MGCSGITMLRSLPLLLVSALHMDGYCRQFHGPRSACASHRRLLAVGIDPSWACGETGPARSITRTFASNPKNCRELRGEAVTMTEAGGYWGVG